MGSQRAIRIRPALRRSRRSRGSGSGAAAAGTVRRRRSADGTIRGTSLETCRLRISAFIPRKELVILAIDLTRMATVVAGFIRVEIRAIFSAVYLLIQRAAAFRNAFLQERLTLHVGRIFAVNTGKIVFSRVFEAAQQRRVQLGFIHKKRHRIGADRIGKRGRAGALCCGRDAVRFGGSGRSGTGKFAARRAVSADIPLPVVLRTSLARTFGFCHACVSGGTGTCG